MVGRHDTGEADRILRIVTHEFGYISALAKGVKKLKSRKAGALELFSIVHLRLHRKTGELFLITEAAMQRNFPTDHLPSITAAYEIAEWCVRLLPAEKPLPEVFVILTDCFQLLARPGARTYQIKLAAKAKLADVLGYLSLECDDVRLKKLLHFCTAKSFAEVMRVTYEAEVFLAAEAFLADVFTSATERQGKVDTVLDRMAHYSN